MSDHVAALAEGLADRLWTRIAAQDRLEALDEKGSGPTLAQRLEARPELLDGVVSNGMDELLGCLAAASRRAALHALRAGETAHVDDLLLSTGLAQASWTGEAAHLSAAGDAASRLLDALAEQVAAVLRDRLARHVPG